MDYFLGRLVLLAIIVIIAIALGSSRKPGE